MRGRAPVRVDHLGIGLVADRDVREQDEIALLGWIVGDQHPEGGTAAGQANLQPAQVDGDQTHLTGMGEGDFQMQGPGMLATRSTSDSRSQRSNRSL